MTTHGPIEKKHHDLMNRVGRALGEGFKGYGFALLIFDLNSHDGRINYISNADRKDMIVAMKEFIARAEGMDVETPKTKQ